MLASFPKHDKLNFMDGWLDITEFALKYGVSASTLRRRIKNNSIQYKMQRGKYLLEDSPSALSHAPLFSRSSAVQNINNQHKFERNLQQHNFSEDFAEIHDPVDDFLKSDKVLPVQLKADYERLEQENRKLKAQISELETLVKALEANPT